MFNNSNLFSQKNTKKIAAFFFLFASVLNFSQVIAQSNTITIDKDFDKIIVNPHIEVVFREGENESVVVEDISVSMDKLNVEVKGKTLHVYLDGARPLTKSKKGKDEWGNNKSSIYKGRIVKMIITSKNVKEYSLRGEEKIVFDSPINRKELQLKIYGESEVTINELIVDELEVAMYGENELKIKKGSTQYQKFVLYGESDINTLDLENKTTKVVAYGEGFLQLNTLEKLKITAYGEAKILYKGDPEITKRIILGEATIKKIK